MNLVSMIGVFSAAADCLSVDCFIRSGVESQLMNKAVLLNFDIKNGFL